MSRFMEFCNNMKEINRKYDAMLEAYKKYPEYTYGFNIMKSQEVTSLIDWMLSKRRDSTCKAA